MTRFRACLIRVPFSRQSGTLIKRRQSGIRRPGVTTKDGWGRFCTGKGTVLTHESKPRGSDHQTAFDEVQGCAEILVKCRC